MAEEFDDKLDQGETIQALTTKEIKKKWRKTFEDEPEKYYPTDYLKSIGFQRKKCPIAGHYFWSKDGHAENCGDSDVVGRYGFIGEKLGIGNDATQDLASVYETYKQSMSSARVPCTPIDRYPVVARWRNDVDFTMAGIFCFQPYCVTGELDPPANPLVMPQFCARFNDLDNIGLTGRHYSGFIMLGNQVFNKPDKYVYFKEETVEFHYNWLTEGLKIDPMEITFIEDIWAGGGNLGPSMEFFVKGMEMGNMVFMQYKTFPDGSIEEIPIKVVDVGIGLDRFPWLLNGTPTSYSSTFPRAYAYLVDKLGIDTNSEVWEKMAPLSARLNVDEVADIDVVWEGIAQEVGMPVKALKEAIEPVRDLYTILDHTRTILMIITDGALPSNVGGGSNLRNIIRRTFSILKKRGWMVPGAEDTSALTFEGYLELFSKHKQDLEGLYGTFKDYESFNEIIRIEYQRYLTTDGKNKALLEKLLKKSKGKGLSMDQWIIAVTTWGIPPDTVAEMSKTEIPGDLYSEIAERQEKIVRAPETVLYDTTVYPATENLYYADHRRMAFDATVVAVLNNLTQKNALNIVILDKSAFYPTSGGQQNDTGVLTLKGETYQVVNVEKVGHCVLHILDRPLAGEPADFVDAEAHGEVDQERRDQLRCHHTATHIVFASAKKVLGPHVWQHGAKKTTKQAHLDITHYSSLTKEQIMQIQDTANRVILSSKNIAKGVVEKAEAELEHGFTLYQGGVVPGNELRVVNIEDTDVEACCGTHCDNTSEVGWVKIVNSKRIADGIVRLYYVAGQRVIETLNAETKVINELNEMWGVNLNDLVATGEKFFNESKHFKTQCTKQQKALVNMEISYVCDVPAVTRGLYLSSEPSPTIYFSFLEPRAKDIKEAGKAVVYVGSNFVIGIAAEEKMVDFEKLQAALPQPEEGKKAAKLLKRNKVGKKKKAVDCCFFSFISALDQEKVAEAFKEMEFVSLEL